MDCKTARMLAELRGNRASELPPEDDAVLQGHLNSCPECQSILQVERRIDSHFAKAIQAVPVPFGLKSRILDRLATERGAWHRRRLFAVAAAAAALLLAVGIFGRPASKARLDLDALVRNADQLNVNPSGKIDDWLAGMDIRYRPKEPLDPHLIAGYGMVEVQGKQVPTLLYHSVDHNLKRSVFAQVFVLREADFDFSSLPKDDEASAGIFRRKVQIVRDGDQPDRLAYVILYEGDSLAPFLSKLAAA
jgi:hypothetical protein